jgi:hypothetical protein
MRRASWLLFLRLMPVLLLSALTLPSVAAAQTAPEPTGTELLYLSATRPFRDRFGAYRELLAAYQKTAAEGKLDSVAMSDLGNLTRELFTAKRTFSEAIPSARLDMYDRTVKLGLDRAYEATVMLLRAQVTNSEADHLALIRQAGEYGANSQRLFNEATDELRSVLPSIADEKFNTQ